MFDTAQFRSPEALCIDASGTLFICDTGNHAIRKISAAGAVSVYAGGTVGLSDGDCTVARFAVNRSIASDALGILYVCDGDTVRKVAPNGTVYTMVGFDPEGGLSNLSGPRGLAVSSTGVAGIADTGNRSQIAAIECSIRMIFRLGQISGLILSAPAVSFHYRYQLPERANDSSK